MEQLLYNAVVEQLTFPFPMGLGSESNVAPILSVELSHEGFVGVSDHDDAGVKGLDLLLAALMSLNADRPPTPPVVPLPFESWERMATPQ